MTCAHNTPFGDINDSEDPLQPLVHSTFADAKRAVRLLGAVVAAIEVDVIALRRKAAGSCLTMTELADTLVREEGLSFKVAHRLVAQTIKRLPQAGEAPDAVAETLMEVARETLGRRLRASAGRLAAALDPLHFVSVRTVAGGPAPETVKRFLAEAGLGARDARRWLQQKSGLLDGYRGRIDRAKHRLIQR
jgi:argininosuccinate lyase